MTQEPPQSWPREPGAADPWAAPPAVDPLTGEQIRGDVPGTPNAGPAPTVSFTKPGSAGDPSGGAAGGGDPAAGYPSGGDPTAGYAAGGYPDGGYPDGGYTGGTYPPGYAAEGYPSVGYPGGAYADPGYPGAYPGGGYQDPGYPSGAYPGVGAPGEAYPPPGYPPTGYPPPYPAPGYPPYGGVYGWAPPRPTNGLAIASVVLGAVWVFWIGSILALVFGYVARNQIRRTGEGGDGAAVAGIVLGWIGIGVLVLGFVLGGLSGR
jgi:hypothetical protein